MKSIIRKNTYKAIYRLLNRVSPVAFDCGTLCGAACCSCEDMGTREDETDFEMGIYLLPGEEKVFTGKEDWLIWTTEEAEDFDFPDSWHGKIHFVRCKTPPHCPREKRPLQCRFFPLAPHLLEDGRLVLIRYDQEIPYQCPLIEDRVALTASFIQATYTVWKHLIRDPLLLDLVEYDSSFREDNQIDLVYDGTLPAIK